MTSVTDLIPVLQTAVGPMILISGVGLLLLPMTNRLAHVINRARLLADELPATTDQSRPGIEGQLAILWSRARLIRTAITLASTSALAAALLIIVIFLTALWRLEIASLIIALFVVCMACLIGSLVVFIRDVNESLSALKLELKTGKG
jgi:hypothetical protein